MNVLHKDFDPALALVNDTDGVVLRGIKDVLEQTRTDLRRKMDAGLTPDEFAVASNLQQACQLAQDIVDQYWAQPRR